MLIDDLIDWAGSQGHGEILTDLLHAQAVDAHEAVEALDDFCDMRGPLCVPWHLTFLEWPGIITIGTDSPGPCRYGLLLRRREEGCATFSSFLREPGGWMRRLLDGTMTPDGGRIGMGMPFDGRAKYVIAGQNQAGVSKIDSVTAYVAQCGRAVLQVIASGWADADIVSHSVSHGRRRERAGKRPLMRYRILRLGRVHQEVARRMAENPTLTRRAARRGLIRRHTVREHPMRTKAGKVVTRHEHKRGSEAVGWTEGPGKIEPGPA